MAKNQMCFRIGVRHLDGPFQSDMPLVVGKVEENHIRLRHFQVLLHQPGISRCPDDSIRCLDPKAAVILQPEYSVIVFGFFILPGMVRRCQRYFGRSDFETVADSMSVCWKSFRLHQFGHIMRPVECFGDMLHCVQRRHAVMVIVAVRNQHCIQMQDVFRRNRHVDQKRHIEVLQHRIHHDAGAAGVHEHPAAAQPADLRVVDRLKSFFSKKYGRWWNGLFVCCHFLFLLKVV